MDAIDVLQDLAARPLQAAEGFADRLSAEKLNAHPGGQDNSIAWLLWHAAREIDAQVADLADAEQVWTAQGFDRRFDLGLDRADMGYGHTPEQARAVVVEDADLLYAYLRAVVDAEQAYLRTLSPEDLAEVIDRSWDPPVTRAARLVSVSEDALQHIGQAAYVLGMDF